MDKILSSAGSAERAATAIIIKDKKVLLGHRQYEDFSKWISPGGRCDDGETIETTLRREVKEEIGVTDLVIKEYLGEFTGANMGYPVFAFLCDFNQKEKLVEAEKFSEWKWFTKDELDTITISENTRKLIDNVL